MEVKMHNFSRARIVRNKTKSETRQHGAVDNGTKRLCGLHTVY